jgi:ABC-type maltose transport system permease subunit
MSNKLVRFGLLFLPLFVAFVFVYLTLLPVYKPIVLGVANAVTTRLSPPTRLESSPSGGWNMLVSEARSEERRVTTWAEFVAHLIFIGLLFLPPLLLATPTTVPDRLRLLGIGMVLLFIVQVLAMICLTRGMYCLTQKPGSFLCLWLLRLVYASGQISGAVVWASLTWRYWVPESWLNAGEETRPA